MATPQDEPAHPLPPTPLPEPVEKKERSDLAARIGTAAVLVPIVIYVIVYGGLPYLVTVLAFGLLAQNEFYQMIEGKGGRPIVGIGLGFGAAVIVVAYIPFGKLGSGYSAVLLMTASLLFAMIGQLRKAQITEALVSISGTFFGVFYVGWLLSHAVLLRFYYTAVNTHFDTAEKLTLGIHAGTGIFLMIYTLAVVILCDAGAYFAGRAWGRRKLAPEISPNKSVEGALGGVVLGTAAGVVAKVVFDVFWPELSASISIATAVVFGVVLCVVGIIGDLVESLLKRDADVKDTGALLPGMGGVLDRIDAPLLGLPMMYYLMLVWGFWRIG